MSLPSSDSPYAVLKNRDFKFFLGARILSSFSQQMMTVAIGWELYQRTNSALSLGLVGLTQIVPMMLLTMYVGYFADTRPRQGIIRGSELLIVIASIGLALVSWFQAPVGLTYLCILLLGTARAFLHPTYGAFLPQVVKREHISRAVTWNSSCFQFAAIMGPAIGGLILAKTLHPADVYVLNAILGSICIGLVTVIRPLNPMQPSAEPFSFENFKEGLRFVFNRKIILATISLDLFAVLLGGATALLPVYARDILHTGPDGLGLLQGALPVGSLVGAILMAHLPPFPKAGQAMLWAVAGFGLATIGFGVSHNLLLSWSMLFICGATDSISVVVRHSLVVLLSPDAMLGRVSAINSLFIGTSNELGGFESGFVAFCFGPIFSVVSGGIGTILVVAWIAWHFKEVRNYGRLEGTRPDASKPVTNTVQS